MNQITEKDINKTLKSLENIAEDPFLYLTDKMSKEQPEILNFLYQPDELNKDQLINILYISHIAWYIIKKVLKRNEEVSVDFLIEQRGRNELHFIDNLNNLKMGEDKIISTLSYRNNQPVLINYLGQLFDNLIMANEDTISPHITAGFSLILKLWLTALSLTKKQSLQKTLTVNILKKILI